MGLHSYTNVNLCKNIRLATGMRDSTFGGRGFAEHQSLQSCFSLHCAVTGMQNRDEAAVRI